MLIRGLLKHFFRAFETFYKFLYNSLDLVIIVDLFE